MTKWNDKCYKCGKDCVRLDEYHQSLHFGLRSNCCDCEILPSPTKYYCEKCRDRKSD